MVASWKFPERSLRSFSDSAQEKSFPLPTTTPSNSPSCDNLSIDIIRQIAPTEFLNLFLRVPDRQMASTGVNILRWSALGAGVLYGVYHQASLSSAAKLAAINRQYEHKQKLIEQAKAEYSKSKLPASAKTTEGDIIRDPNDSRFDLEAYLNVIAAENK
ncbi:hypothetical protein G7Y89_g12299 [Cudoniella acicularis]|uniref:ATP synthase F(0) complex subunit e, mitochondrial n=1 Tax=Cudoniella acicularis TaxID=354080 RepID=A0A8H4RC39_9HELO|nr:hypothetical protein G7Y89_g12299 [Cudoniella acicularis]